jgi:hypothetical protein
MTQDEIIEMARQAGSEAAKYPSLIPKSEWKTLEAFAKLVEDKVRQEIAEKNAPVIKKVNEHIKELQDAVKAEREACAKVCEDLMLKENPYERWEGMKWCMDRIRARGEA